MIKQKITEKLNYLVANYLRSKNIDENLKFSIEVPPKNINADFATNAAMLIAKKTKTNPRVVAQELVNKILKEMAKLIEKVDIAGVGFINLHVRDKVLYDELITIVLQKEEYGKVLNGNNKKVMVEFVSANPTGPLHVGHGRGAAIGDSLSRILKHLGYNVTKEYYLNDVGNQMFVLARSTELRYRQLKGEQFEFPQDHYQGRYITGIAERLISEGKDIKDIDFKTESVKDILKTIENDLRDFAVEFDSWFSEGTIASVNDGSSQTQVDKACQYFLEKGDAYIKDNALWLASTKFGDDKDRVLKRSDGRYTYLASDVAYHKNKFERGFSKLINLWGADHHGYVKRIKACVQMLGFDQHNLNIILYQLVSLVRKGSPVAMSTRTGEFITLKEVVDEVGKDACRFFFLLSSPNSPLEFDLELAKKQSSENPVFYVQYVSARCNSIIKESKNRKDIVNDINSIDLTLLNTKEEKDLIKQLAAFCDMLFLSEKLMSPHCFTSYLIELADRYHAFYEKCRVLSEDLNLTSSRLKLIEGVMIVIRNGLNLLGVSVPEKM
jgi:arginyl-tRNA synthetase